MMPLPDLPEGIDALKRYDLVTSYRCGSAIEEMTPADDGEWVRWSDLSNTTPTGKQEILMKSTELRELARTVLAEQLRATKVDTDRVHAAIQVLHAPDLTTDKATE